MKYWETGDWVLAVALTMFGSLLVFLLVFGIYLSPAKKAELINAEFGTSYSWYDMMTASTTIDKIIVGNKHRIDITDKEAE